MCTSSSFSRNLSTPSLKPQPPQPPPSSFFINSSPPLPLFTVTYLPSVDLNVEADREIAVDHVTQLSRTNKSRSRGLGFRYAPVSLFFIVDRAVVFSVVSLSKHQVELLKSNLHQPSEPHALVSCSLRSSQVHPSRHSFASHTLSDRLCQAELFPTSKPHVHSSSLTSHARLNHPSRTRKRPSRMPFPLDPSRLADLLFIQLVFESLSLFFVIFQPILVSVSKF